MKGIGFLLLGIGLSLQIPKYIKKYNKEKNIEDLLQTIGIILLGASSIILGIAKFI
ncbi:MAG: hypothetical protein Q4P29_01720 [Tissierellia bacterium]|nr:hypothetical protein [Tissierellia bacterium]